MLEAIKARLRWPPFGHKGPDVPIDDVALNGDKALTILTRDLTRTDDFSHLDQLRQWDCGPVRCRHEDC